MSLWVLVALGSTAAGAFVQGALVDWLGLGLTLGLTGGAGIALLIGSMWQSRGQNRAE